jgi:hypothetical protein
MTKLVDIMNNLAMCATAVLLGGLGSLSASSIAANAQGLEIEIGPNGSQLGLRDEGSSPRHERCRRDDHVPRAYRASSARGRARHDGPT